MQPAERITCMLDELCVGLGFCLPPDSRARLTADPPADPDALVLAVFRAEGLDPAADRQLHRQVREVIRRAWPSGAQSGA